MRTAETLRLIMTTDRAVYRAFRNLCTEQMQALIRIHRMTESAGPKATAEVLAHEIGRPEANALLASLVNRAAHDGRYDQPVKEWAAKLDNANDAEAADMLGIYTDKIHPTHLNQIALSLMAHRKG